MASVSAGCASSNRGPAGSTSTGDGGASDAAVQVVAAPDAAVVVSWCTYPSLHTSPPASVSDFATALENALCARLVRCGALPNDGAVSCAQKLALSSTFTGLVADAAAGSVVLDSEGARTCLDAVTQATCDKAATYCIGGQQRYEAAVGDIANYDATFTYLSWQGPSCARALHRLAAPALLPDGAPCSPSNQGNDCASGQCGLTLGLPDGGTSSTGYACVARQGLGGPCAYPYLLCPTTEGTCPQLICDADLYCAPVATNVAAMNGGLDGYCAMPGDVGMPCTGRLYELDCRPGLYCGPNGTCSARLAAGASCTAPYACEDGLLCAGLRLDSQTIPSAPMDGPLTVIASGTCALPVPVGGACTPPSAYPTLNALGAEGCTFLAASCDAWRCVADPGAGDACQMGGAPCDLLARPQVLCQCPATSNGVCGGVGSCQ
jgi:hypothetical protein